MKIQKYSKTLNAELLASVNTASGEVDSPLFIMGAGEARYRVATPNEMLAAEGELQDEVMDHTQKGYRHDAWATRLYDRVSSELRNQGRIAA